MTPQQIERQGDGRRKEDERCLVHEERLIDTEKKVSTQSGWLKAASGLVAVGIFVGGIIATMVMNKLENISTMLTDYKVTQQKHTDKIESLERDVRDINERNRYIDQRDGRIGSGNPHPTK